MYKKVLAIEDALLSDSRTASIEHINVALSRYAIDLPASGFGYRTLASHIYISRSTDTSKHGHTQKEERNKKETRLSILKTRNYMLYLAAVPK
jgi:hypothetical protein